MKKFLAVLATLITGTAFACMDHDFYPVVLGATWTYDMQGEQFTQTIVDVTPDGYTIEANVADQVVSMDFICQDDGIVQLGMPGLGDMGVAMDIEILELEGVQFPARFAPGETWTYKMTMAMKMSMEMEGMGNMVVDSTSVTSADNRFGDPETVTVPAGTFTALPMYSDSNVSLTMSMMGMTLPATDVASTSTTWYVEGVGMVRQESDGSSVMELVSYSIP